MSANTEVLLQAMNLTFTLISWESKPNPWGFADWSRYFYVSFYLKWSLKLWSRVGCLS